ncbi:MAG: hypothetical protein O2864_06025 [Crenarchaeota archaeon]|nr:hypothetical protein [Thermoproteota archaeon]
MNRNVGIATGIGIAVIIGVIVFQVNETAYHVTSPEDYTKSIGTGSVSHVVYQDNPQFLGPLQINKDKYLLGESVHVILRDLRPQDKGAVLFITPGNIIYDEWLFDGNKKEIMKKYFKPSLIKSKNLCEKKDLVGEWTVMFKGYDMAKLHFEVLPDVLPRMENQFIECSVAYEIDIFKP